jgi:hypothetical protein
MRGLVLAAAGCLLLTACAGGGTTPGEPTGAPAVPTQTATESPSADGEVADPDTIQLLYISDSTGWKVGEAYAALAEEELRVPVELVSGRIPSLAMVDAVRWVEENAADVAEAEIVVLWANPMRSGVKEGHEYCFGMPAYRDPGTYDEVDWAPFAEVAGEALDAIWAARGDRPAVLRVTDVYTPVVADWEEHGIRDECMAVFEGISDAMRSAAESHGATFVSALDVYNGTDHRQDPVVAGLISSDGIHPGKAGGQAMAEAFAATGFAPTTAP